MASGDNHFIIMIGDIPLAEIQVKQTPSGEDPSLPGFATPIDPSGVTLSCVAPRAMARCRSRKRFIKLLCATMGVQRNDARYLAEVAFRAGRHSYFDLWCDAYIFMVEAALRLMTKERNEQNDPA